MLFIVLVLVILVSVSCDKLLTAGDPSKYVFHESFHNTTISSTSSWVSYKQCDSRWGGNQLGFCAGTTICQAGCAMSSVAMMLATKGGGVDPGSLNSWLDSNGGYSGCDIYWGSVDKLGLTSFQGIENASESEICNGLSQGHGIIANVMNGGHWVLLTGCLGNGVFSVNDPGFSYTQYSINDIVREAVYH